MTDADVTEPASQHSDAEAPVPYRSGFVAVVGRPNVGKSTLINALIGTQIAIASSRPETTRKAIRGILTTDNAQIVLVDTPGIHRPRTLLGQRNGGGAPTRYPMSTRSPSCCPPTRKSAPATNAF